MKSIIILIVAISLISTSASGQKNPPENVKKEFTKKFPAAQNVKWSREEDNEWEAEFKTKEYEMSASFDDSGKWLETETEVTSKELPAAVTASLKKDFAGYKTGEITFVENPQLKGYEIVLKKSETSIEVLFDKNGAVLKKTDLKNEKEEDEKK